MAYVDGFIVAVPKKKLAEYRKLAKRAGKVWREHGATSYTECIADDVPMGKITSFPRSVKQKPVTMVVNAAVPLARRHSSPVVKITAKGGAM